MRAAGTGQPDSTLPHLLARMRDPLITAFGDTPTANYLNELAAPDLIFTGAQATPAITPT